MDISLREFFLDWLKPYFKKATSTYIYTLRFDFLLTTRNLNAYNVSALSTLFLSPVSFPKLIPYHLFCFRWGRKTLLRARAWLNWWNFRFYILKSFVYIIYLPEMATFLFITNRNEVYNNFYVSNQKSDLRSSNRLLSLFYLRLIKRNENFINQYIFSREKLLYRTINYYIYHCTIVRKIKSSPLKVLRSQSFFYDDNNLSYPFLIFIPTIFIIISRYLPGVCNIRHLIYLNTR